MIVKEWKQKIQMIRISIHLRFSGIWCSVACWEKSVRFWQQQQQVVFGSLGMNPHGGMTMTSRQHSLLILVLNFYQVEQFDAALIEFPGALFKITSTWMLELIDTKTVLLGSWYVVTTTFGRLILNTKLAYFLTSIVLDDKYEKILRIK